MNTKQFWNEILSGEDAVVTSGSTPQPKVSCLACEDGMISFVAMVAILFFLILIGLIGNVGLTVNNKIEIQNAADSAAYSSGIFVARGMNTVTASNHLIGELLALSVIHHAICGPEGDTVSSFQSTRIPQSERQRVGFWKSYLGISHARDEFASAIPIPAPPMPAGAYQLASKGPSSSEGAMVFRSKLRLMKILNSAHIVHGVGAIMQSIPGMFLVFDANLGFPPNVPYALYKAQQSYQIGNRLCNLSADWGRRVEEEWKYLDTLSQLAQNLSPVKAAMKGVIIALYAQARFYSSGLAMDSLHREMLENLDEIHHVESITYFGRGGLVLNALSGEQALKSDLPLKPEPESQHLPVFTKSQLVRAAFPWVNYWRQTPLRLFHVSLALSRGAHHYKDFTNQFTLDLARELKDAGVNLLIIEGLDLAGSDKGSEPWTANSLSSDSLRDRLFAQVGLARRDAPDLISSGFYHPENSGGFVCYSQSFIYNANRQTPRQTPTDRQPRVAWDTLNWVNDVAEYKKQGGHSSYFHTGGDPDPPFDEPRIYINWRTKLVPASRLHELSDGLPTRFGEAIRRLPIGHFRREPSQFRTH